MIVNITHRTIRRIWALPKPIFVLLIAIGTVAIIIISSCVQTPSAVPPQTQGNLSTYILIDQFGYRPKDSKVAVIVQSLVDTKTGEPGLPAQLSDSYQVVNAENQQSVYESKAEIWQDGAIHEQSGDRAAWFNFSSVSQPGSYVIKNSRTGDVSATFDISEDVYRSVLITVTRMFFYQRSGFAKQPPYTDKKWADEAAFLGPGQDTEARFVNDKENAALERDMRGGWFDAGDTNKYVTFAATPVHQLLDSYSQNSNIWTDDFNIPESGNGIPDILDEIRYELDWLITMQDDDGGSFIKLGTIDYQIPEKPSLDKRPRYYAPKCSSATIDTAGMFAHAALVFKTIPSLSSYADDLQSRALKAWQWYNNNPKETDCDTQEIKAGDADRGLEEQEESAIAAAVYLFALTQDADFQEYVTTHASDLCLYCNDTWYPYHVNVSDALLFYSQLRLANPDLKKKLQDNLTQLATNSPVYKADNSLDPYGAYMPSDQYHWGSNAIKALYGISSYDIGFAEVNSQLLEDYRAKALAFLHYFHGVNPLGLVYLTNMYEYGAENSANELHHDWFGHGIYDNALTSPSGPAPGYLPGGPNKNYTGEADISTQYPMKAYLDSNNKYHEMKMWEISEPAIYYQSAYLKLLSILSS
jgi:hypothetical protein